jgi:phosphatidylinositol alpha-1,6-mannosyltransferase
VKRHLLVTNDFPPKVGGIQNYLWELWRRLPADSFTVLTTPYRGAARFDAEQPYGVVRTREPWLLPHPVLAKRIDRLADEFDAELVILDPALPLGHLGPWLRHDYGVVLHGAEVTVPGRLPISRSLLARVLRDARLVVAAGGYPAAEGQRVVDRPLPTVVIPPGVDASRFHPLTDAERREVRLAHGLRDRDQVVLGISRLVPRKGFDALIEAAALLHPTHPDLVVLIGGSGRDRRRLEQLANRRRAPVRFLGRVAEADLAPLHASADAFAMICRSRWAGLEQEGFGIVFVEAAAAGVPSVAGASGGSAEAVVDGETGLVVDPDDIGAVTAALARLLDDPDGCRRMGRQARARVEADLTYDVLAARLGAAIDAAT